MKTRFTRIEGRSRQYYLFMLACAGVAALLPLSAICIFVNGHHVTGMTNQVPWGMPIVMAIYLIGASAGSLVLSAMSSVFGKAEYKPFSRMSALLAVILIVSALLAIILDWGRPDRILVPFTHFQPRSMFSLNAILYSSYIALGLVYLWAMFNDKKRLEKTLGIAAVALAILVHSGTGAIFGFVFSRELYNSSLMPPSFISAALSSGTAMMIITIHLTFSATGRRVDDELIQKLGRLMGIFIIVVLYFIFIENTTRSYAPKNYTSAQFLLLNGGVYPLLFWVGLVGLGLLAPMAIVFHPRYGKSIKWILAGACLQLLGVLVERYLIVIPAQLIPLDILPGKEITSAFLDGQYAHYHVSLVEATYSLGLVGVVVLIYALAIKLWPILPEEATAQGAPAASSHRPCGEQSP